MTDLFTKEVVSSEPNLRQLELAINRKLDGLLHGDYQGLLPGAGTDAGGGRLYNVGDDVRRIDWNLSARSNATHVRETIADRELETWLVIDGTASLDYGTARCEKRDLVLAVTAAFGFLTARAGNRIGAVVFDGAQTDVVAPRGGRESVLALLHRLQRRPPASSGSGSLAAALRRVQFLARRRGLVVVVSDLLDDSDWSRELRTLGARHEVVVAHVSDPREDDLPAVGMLTLVDAETGELHEVQTASKRFRARYAAAANERRATTMASIRASRAGHLEVSTDRDWLLDIVKFVVAKRRRR
ncbi:MAG: hypothetical protein QOH64_1395 [Acidimicrobiaceae bacterium]|jgi:uncharacterized protein (DUF58 family)